MKSYKLPFLPLIVLLLSTQLFAQKSDRDTGIEFYNKSNFQAAAAALKKAVKTDGRDMVAMYYLGLAYIRSEKYREAVMTLEKAGELSPDDSKLKAALAFAYLHRNSPKAAAEASAALKLDPKNADASYVLGVTNLRNGSFNAAYENASRAIDANPKLAPPYLLRSQALVSSFALQTGTIVKPKNARNQLLYEATEDLQKFVDLAPNSEDIEYHQEYLTSLKFFSEFYKSVDAREGLDPDQRPEPSVNTTPLKIISKPRASYTDRARSAGVSGNIRILVGLGG